KDNIVFHSIIFPAMLMAHGGFILPDNIPANEFLNIGGEKFSKSRGNGILVKDIAEKFSADVIRYTLASLIPENKDSEFTWQELQSKNNNELAAILGNFINRTVVFAKTKFNNKITSRNKETQADIEILDQFKKSAIDVSEHYNNFKFKDALTETMNAVRAANKYFNDSEPWKLIKEDKERCETVINTCLEICHSTAILISPVLPFTSDKILKILNKDKTDFNWSKIGELVLKPGNELGESEILFPQIEDKQIEELNSNIEDKNIIQAEINADKELTNVISIDDFKKISLKVAKIIECELVPKSKKLLKLKLKVGDREKQIVSGISEFYKPEDLIGKHIVIVDNLKPSKLMGIDSEGMLLAAKKEGELKIITIDGEISDGAE
ncbi:MAG: methionine--tRNA ligase subunit beta, partial [Ignavibacteria bacterium]|nr:methionine--tRNA ligase subunit beta [Ignavibacteria bacterium]